MMDTEKFYDDEIAPALKVLAEKCLDRGLNFVAVVEYKPGEIGRICYMKDECLQMTMINHCARTAPNVDAYMIGLIGYARKNKIDFKSSIYMMAFEKESK